MTPDTPIRTRLKVLLVWILKPVLVFLVIAAGTAACAGLAYLGDANGRRTLKSSFLPDTDPAEADWTSTMTGRVCFNVKGASRQDYFQFLQPGFARADMPVRDLFCDYKLTALIITEGIEAEYRELGGYTTETCESGARAVVQLQLSYEDYDPVVLTRGYIIPPPQTSSCGSAPLVKAAKAALSGGVHAIWGTRLDSFADYYEPDQLLAGFDDVPWNEIFAENNPEIIFPIMDFPY